MFARESHDEISPETLAVCLRECRRSECCIPYLIIDCRNFVDYNNSHIHTAVNAFYSKIMRRRLLDEKVCPEFVINHLSHGLTSSLNECDNMELVLYDENYLFDQDVQTKPSTSTEVSQFDTSSFLLRPFNRPMSRRFSSTIGLNGYQTRASARSLCSSSSSSSTSSNDSTPTTPPDEKPPPAGLGFCKSSQAVTDSAGLSEHFIRLLFNKLKVSHGQKPKFGRIRLLKGGFFGFQRRFPDLCEPTSGLSRRVIPELPGPVAEVYSNHTNSPNSGSDPNDKLFQMWTQPSNGHPQPISAEVESDQSKPKFHLAVESPEVRQPQIVNEKLLGSAPVCGSSMKICGGWSSRTSTPLKIPQSWSCGAIGRQQQSPTGFGVEPSCSKCEEKEDQLKGPTQILEFMYLGSQNDALDPELLQKYGITKVINLSENCPRPELLPDDPDHFLRIPIKDSYSAKLLPHFNEAFEFIESAHRSGTKCLLHCLAGISRSATLAIAYIMRSQCLASDEAYRFVKSRRPSIAPNFNFMGQLMEYERQLREQNLIPALPGNSPLLRSNTVPSACYSPSGMGSSSVVSISTEKTSTMTLESKCYSEEETHLSNRSTASTFSSRKLLSMSGGKEKSKSPSPEPASSTKSCVNKNGKRPLDYHGLQLAYPPPNRPRQLLKDFSDLAKVSAKPNEDIPSPSTEFSKLDISLANPCFGLMEVASNHDGTSRSAPKQRNKKSHHYDTQTISPARPSTFVSENPMFNSLAFNIPSTSSSTHFRAPTRTMTTTHSEQEYCNKPASTQCHTSLLRFLRKSGGGPELPISSFDSKQGPRNSAVTGDYSFVKQQQKTSASTISSNFKSTVGFRRRCLNQLMPNNSRKRNSPPFKLLPTVADGEEDVEKSNGAGRRVAERREEYFSTGEVDNNEGTTTSTRQIPRVAIQGSASICDFSEEDDAQQQQQHWDPDRSSISSASSVEIAVN